MHIASRDNSKIKLYIKLAGSKKARQENGLFVIEGARLCSEAIAKWQEGELEIYAAFASLSALEKYGEYIDKTLFDDNNSFFTIEDKLCGAMSDTKAGQGVYIIAKMSSNELFDDSLRSGGKYLVLDNVQDPGNLGTLIRTADAVGIDGVVLSNNCCDLYNPKTLRSAMGSLFRINVFVCNDFSRVVSVMKKHGIKTYAAVVDSSAISVTKADLSNGCGVVIGNEGNGLCNADADMCDEALTIKMHGNIDSLNAATAGSIILWEMTRNGDENA